MAIEKQIKTKISLRYLDYATWSAESFKTEKPLKGEVWFCAVPQGNPSATTAPTMLFKVGDGVNTFGDLNWASALAADVYSWAKKSESEFIEWVNTVVEHPAAPVITTGGANGTIAVDGTDVAVKGLGSAAYTEASAYATSEQGTKADNAAAAIATYGDIVTHNVAEFATKAQGDKADSAVQSVTLAGGTNNGTLKLTVDGQATDNIAVTGLGDAAYTTVAALNATAKGYADAVEAKLPTSADYGVLEVKGDEASGVVVDKTDAQRPVVKIAANTYDAHGAAAEVQGNLTVYENAHASDYTNTKIDELVQGAKDYADANDANTEYHVEYDSTNKKIKLVAGADASKMEIDATDFIKDGMIESVELVTEDDGGNKGQFLKITWNTDGDVDADDVTYVNVTTLVDVYVGENGDYVNVTVTSDNKIKADLTDAAKTKLNKVWEEVGVAAGLDATLKAELQKEIDDDIAAYDTSKNFGDIITHNASEFASSTENGAKELAQGVKDVVDANKETWDKAGTALQASDLTAYDTGKNFGDIITHNVAEFATSAEAGAKALADQNKLAIDAINHAETGILAQAKKDAADKSAVVLSEAQKYADEAVANSEHISEITTTENGGLKVTNKNHIDIDPDVIFVLDCNW